MTLLKKLALTAAALVLATTDSHALGRRPLFRRVCVSPAPVRAVFAPRYDTIPRPLVPVPAIPPEGFTPAVGVLTLPSRVVQAVGRCVGGTCNVR
jgi:hypothetical protein